MNQLIITGNLGKDPEIIWTKDGTAITNMSVAVRQRKKENGEWTDAEPMWLQVKFFGKLAESVVESYHKGNLVTVSGRLQQTHYTAKDGSAATSLDVIANEIQPVEKRVKETEEAPKVEQAESAPF